MNILPPTYIHINSFLSTVTQTALVNLNELQNKMKRHKHVKGSCSKEGGLIGCEKVGVEVKMPYIHV